MTHITLLTVQKSILHMNSGQCALLPVPAALQYKHASNAAAQCPQITYVHDALGRMVQTLAKHHGGSPQYLKLVMLHIP